MIAIDGEITVTDGIKISSKHIQLIGGSNGGNIIFNTGSNSKSVYLEENAKLILGGNDNSLIIDGSNTSRTYSLITVDGGNQLTLNENCTIQNANTNGTGGAIKLNGGSFTMNGGVLKDNSASYGAGITTSAASSITLNGGEIINNSATKTGTYGGGGIYVGAAGTFTVSNITFNSNSSGYKGADIFIYDSSANLTISNCSFETNEKSAIYANYGNVTVNGESITGSWNP